MAMMKSMSIIKGLKFCPVCKASIDSEGNRYRCMNPYCRFSMLKPKCKKCGGIRMFAEYIQAEEISFGCMDCRAGIVIKIGE